MFCSQDIYIIDCREGGMDFVWLGKAVRTATYCDIAKAWVSHQQQWNQPLEWFCHRSRTWIQPSERRKVECIAGALVVLMALWQRGCWWDDRGLGAAGDYLRPEGLWDSGRIWDEIKAKSRIIFANRVTHHWHTIGQTLFSRVKYTMELVGWTESYLIN